MYSLTATVQGLGQGRNPDFPSTFEDIHLALVDKRPLGSAKAGSVRQHHGCGLHQSPGQDQKSSSSVKWDLIFLGGPCQLYLFQV